MNGNIFYAYLIVLKNYHFDAANHKPKTNNALINHKRTQPHAAHAHSHPNRWNQLSEWNSLTAGSTTPMRRNLPARLGGIANPSCGWGRFQQSFQK